MPTSGGSLLRHDEILPRPTIPCPFEPLSPESDAKRGSQLGPCVFGVLVPNQFAETVFSFVRIRGDGVPRFRDLLSCVFPLPWLYRTGTESGEEDLFSEMQTGFSGLSIGRSCPCLAEQQGDSFLYRIHVLTDVRL